MTSCANPSQKISATILGLLLSFFTCIVLLRTVPAVQGRRVPLRRRRARAAQRPAGGLASRTLRPRSSDPQRRTSSKAAATQIQPRADGLHPSARTNETALG